MNRFLSKSVIVLALVVAGFVQAPAASAEVTGVPQNGQACATDSHMPAVLDGIMQNGVCVLPANYVSQSAANTPTPQKGSVDSAYNGIMQKIMELFAWLVGVAALTLDYAVYYTVVHMGSYVQKLTAIGVSWRILRDIGNIMLIFGFLAIGISTILNTERLGWGKKMLPMLMVAAVFLNFSLFFTEAIIDAGNLFATQFYTQINGGKLPQTNGAGLILATDGAVLGTANEGISNKLMAQLGLQTIYGNGTVNTKIFEAGNPWLIGFLGILLFIITAFVLFSLAFILIARFVMLIFLIILAPVGFAGLAIPQLRGMAGRWWDKLFEQTITAPVLLLLLYVALAVITDAQFLTGFGTGSSGAATGFVEGLNLPGFAGFVLSFLVAMGLLLLVTISAKSLSAAGAGKATKLAGGLTGALSFGAISLAGRGTLGTAGYLLNNKRMQARAAKGGKIGLAAKAFSFTGRNLEKRTFDVRNIGAAKGLGALGIDVGKGATVTAKTAIDTSREAVKTYKPFQGEWWRDQQKEYEKAASERERERNLATPGTPDFAKAINKMSDDELAELKGIRQGLDSFVGVLSPAKYASVSKSPKLLAGEKKKLDDAWDAQFTTHAKSAGALGRMSDDERATLDSKILAKPEVLENLSADDFDNIRGKLKPGPDKDAIVAYVKGIVDGTTPVPPTAPPTLQAQLTSFATNPKFKNYFNIP
ncbi:MAG: hypothetical protein WAV50_02505 [Minisyncoccia bacterium]